ncbi:MAG: Gfo/Idh/MocA family oxidoreductase [Acidobacteriota bacterium]|nr:Gfo/Idh/MocA family oxidoreductase [Acidobacteriota bacterium]
MDNGNSHVSRRDFLKNTAVAGAGLAAFGGLAPARVLGANDRVRMALIGCGERGSYDMSLFMKNPGVEFVALCDVYEPRRLRQQHVAGPGAQAYLDYHEVLDRKDIDAVLIGVPDHWHKQVLVDAVHAGKDAYCEKPIMHNIPEGVEMVEAVKQTGRVVQTGTQQRSWPHYIMGKQLIDSGMLGDVAFVYTYWFQNYIESTGWMARHPVDTSELNWKMFLGDAPDQPFTVEKFFHWRFFWDFGGGALTDLLTHWIDVIQWYMNQSAPKTATTTGDVYFMNWQCPDTITAAYEYPGKFNVTFNCALNNSIDDGGIEFRGTKATLKIDRSHLAVYPEGVRWQPYRNYPEPEILIRSEHDGTIDHVRNFLDCMRTRKSPNANIEVGFEAARASWIGNIALKRGLKTVWNASTEKVVS